MSTFSIIVIACGLAMDAFAVSVSSGITIKKMHVRHAMLIALFFGGFQAFMPVIGWLIGSAAKSLVQACDHWIAFGLLSLIGLKMIVDAVRPGHDKAYENPLDLYVLFVMAIATSIDALVVGITLPLLSVSMVFPVIVIGVVTFAFSFAGTYIGNIVGKHFEKWIEVAGGVALIGIGLKIVLEHTGRL